MLDKKLLYSLQNDNLNSFEIYLYESVTSTNDLAKEFAQSNKDKEAVIIASSQTAGRGRRGRSFFSPEKTGLYMSILLRPSFLPQITSLLTPCAALCVAKAIEKVSGVSTKIKWINDVYIDKKKVAGILCESSFSPEKNQLDYVIVGIGINISTPIEGFPEDIKDIATSIFGSNTPSSYSIEKLAASIINEIYSYSLNLDSRAFIAEYKTRLCMLGEEIEVITPNETYTARAVDIDENAHLIVSLSNGSKRVLDAGEISIKNKKER
ncbi:MAG: biotin--[Clostridia bacterium]|nr:biotin--[acetyl-CoA-carboxylase] ligase [Clostridia bacterium]